LLSAACHLLCRSKHTAGPQQIDSKSTQGPVRQDVFAPPQLRTTRPVLLEARLEVCNILYFYNINKTYVLEVCQHKLICNRRCRSVSAPVAATPICAPNETCYGLDTSLDTSANQQRIDDILEYRQRMELLRGPALRRLNAWQSHDLR
jgi:hypothetical protein